MRAFVPEPPNFFHANHPDASDKYGSEMTDALHLAVHRWRFRTETVFRPKSSMHHGAIVPQRSAASSGTVYWLAILAGSYASTTDKTFSSDPMVPIPTGNASFLLYATIRSSDWCKEG